MKFALVSFCLGLGYYFSITSASKCTARGKDISSDLTIMVNLPLSLLYYMVVRTAIYNVVIYTIHIHVL